MCQGEPVLSIFRTCSVLVNFVSNSRFYSTKFVLCPYYHITSLEIETFEIGSINISGEMTEKK